MAWQAAGYALAAAVLLAAAAFAIAMVSAMKTIRRLDRVAAAVGKEAEETLRRCASLAEEAGEAIALSKRGLEGFASLAEGARAIGESARTVAAAAIRVAELYRDVLSAPFQTEERERESSAEGTDAPELGRTLWALLQRWLTEKGRSP